MKFKDFKALGLLLFGMLLMASCEYDSIVFAEPDPNEPVEDVSFMDEIIPIFQDNCVGCHGVGHYKVDLTIENAYQSLNDKGLIDVNDPANSVIYKTLTVNVASQHQLTPPPIKLILDWITQGAKDN